MNWFAMRILINIFAIIFSINLAYSNGGPYSIIDSERPLPNSKAIIGRLDNEKGVLQVITVRRTERSSRIKLLGNALIGKTHEALSKSIKKGDEFIPGFMLEGVEVIDLYELQERLKKLKKEIFNNQAGLNDNWFLAKSTVSAFSLLFAMVAIYIQFEPQLYEAANNGLAPFCSVSAIFSYPIFKLLTAYLGQEHTDAQMFCDNIESFVSEGQELTLPNQSVADFAEKLTQLNKLNIQQ